MQKCHEPVHAACGSDRHASILGAQCTAAYIHTRPLCRVILAGLNCHGHCRACWSCSSWKILNSLHAMQIGDLIDMHQYVGPNSPLPTLTRAAVLGEFGGLGLRLEGHVWIPEDSFSYQQMQSPAELEVSQVPAFDFKTFPCSIDTGLGISVKKAWLCK